MLTGALWSVCGLLALAQTPATGEPGGVRVARERIVLHTVGGDIVLALYPDVAPRHVRQMLRLVQLGCYDGTHFSRVEPDFVIQLANVYQRRHDLTRDQVAAIHLLPAEFSKTLKHRRGSLSMAHYDDDPDSGETSFSILLSEQPHMDGKYTIFGHVESGMDVVDRLVGVLRFPVPGSDKVTLPVVPLEVIKAVVIPQEKLAGLELVQAHPVSIPPGTLAEKYLQTVEENLRKKEEVQLSPVALGGVGLMLVLALASFLLNRRIPANWQQSITLLLVLVASFVLLALLLPYSQRNQVLAAALFLGVVGLFKIMGRFESSG